MHVFVNELICSNSRLDQCLRKDTIHVCLPVQSGCGCLTHILCNQCSSVDKKQCVLFVACAWENIPYTLDFAHHMTLCLAVMQRMHRHQLHFKHRSMHSTRSRRSMGRASWCRPRPLPPTLVLATPPEGPLLPLGSMKTGTEASVLADALLLPM